MSHLQIKRRGNKPTMIVSIVEQSVLLLENSTMHSTIPHFVQREAYLDGYSGYPGTGTIQLLTSRHAQLVGIYS